VAKAGGLDAVVCGAGYGVFGAVEDLPIEKARAQLETNVIGTLTVLRAALPHLRRAQGRVVVVGSLAGRAPIPFQSHYSASKAALDAITLALRIEVAPFGVGVSLIEPGDIATPFNDNMDWGRTASPPTRRPARLRAGHPRVAPEGAAPDVVGDVILQRSGPAAARALHGGARLLLVPWAAACYRTGCRCPSSGAISRSDGRRRGDATRAPAPRAPRAGKPRTRAAACRRLSRAARSARGSRRRARVRGHGVHEEPLQTS
jgi:hypothetical protein